MHGETVKSLKEVAVYIYRVELIIQYIAST